MSKSVRETIEAISISPQSTIRQALRAINTGALGIALLVEPDSGRFAGLVTDGDIRRALLKGLGLESSVIDVPRPKSKTALLGTSPENLHHMFSDQVRVVPLLDEHEHVVDLAILNQRLRLPVAEPSLGERELHYVSECVLTGWVSSAGAFVTRFEEMVAACCGTQYAIATSSGTTALHLALLALDIGPGDEVIVPSMTFIATANAVRYTGATPVFVDSEEETWNIDPAHIARAITPRTRAIIPVHIYGHPANMEPVLSLAQQHRLYVIEDAAEAHGARYQGRPVGGLGDLAIFSFYGNKIITTGEGGMVTTSRSDLVDKIRLLRDHGMSRERRYWHTVLGYNYRLTNLQAAVGVAQMEKLDAILAEKHRIARLYTEGLRDIPGIRLPPHAPWAEPVCWLYSILVEPGRAGRTRDELMMRLNEEGIDTRPLFPAVHRQPIYCTGQNLPVAEYLAETGLSLPSAIGLRAEDIFRVVEKIRRFFEG
jgi:perosamine synthetase